MIPCHWEDYRHVAGFPRVSGDDPVTQQGGADKPMFSPRERG